jgi:hypothetical protein
MAMEEIEADSYWSEKMRSYTKEKFVCVNCGMSYKESDNIGRWKCSQHPYFPSVSVGGIWPCCGKLSKPKPVPMGGGCVRCDHTVLNCSYDSRHDIPLPKFVAERIGVDRTLPSVVKVGSQEDIEDYDNEEEKKDARDNYVTVRRYDTSRRPL